MKGWSTSLMTTTPMIQEYLRKYARHSEYWLSPNFISSLLLVSHKTHSYLHTSLFMFKYPYIHIWNIHFQRSPYWRGVSVFPVGLVLKYGVSSPILRDGRVTGFYDAFQAGRKVTRVLLHKQSDLKLFLFYFTIIIFNINFKYVIIYQFAMDMTVSNHTNSITFKFVKKHISVCNGHGWLLCLRSTLEVSTWCNLSCSGIQLHHLISESCTRCSFIS